MLFLAAHPHHHRRIRFLREEHRDDQRDRARDLAAEPPAGVFADDDDVRGIDADPPGHPEDGLGRALSARVHVDLAVLPVRHHRPGLQRLMAGVWRDERFVENERCILEARVEVAVRPLLGRLAHRQTAVLDLSKLRFGPFQITDLGTRWTLPSTSAARWRWGRGRDIPVVALGPGIGAAGTEAHQRIHNEGQRLKLDHDFFNRVGGGELVDRGDSQDRLALIHRLVRERHFSVDICEDELSVVIHGVSGGRKIVGGQNRLDAGHRQRGAQVEARHARVRQRAQQELGEDHPLRAKVFGVLRLPCDLRDQIGSNVVLSDELVFSHDHAFRKFSAPRIIAVRILS